MKADRVFLPVASKYCGSRAPAGLEAVEGDALQLRVQQAIRADGAAVFRDGAAEHIGELVIGADVALHVEPVREQTAGGAGHVGGRAFAAGRPGQRALDLAGQDHGLVSDLLFQRPEAQGAVEAPGHSQLGGRTRTHGQADQSGVAPSAAGLGNGGFEALARAHRRDVHGVREGGGDGGGFFRRDAGAAHGLLEGFAATDLDRNRLGRGQAGGHAGGRKGLVRKDGDLGLGERRSLFRFRGLVYATGKQRHRDRGHRRKGVGRDAHRLATWIELSHRSPTNDDADRRQSH